MNKFEKRLDEIIGIEQIITMSIEGDTLFIKTRKGETKKVTFKESYLSGATILSREGSRIRVRGEEGSIEELILAKYPEEKIDIIEVEKTETIIHMGNNKFTVPQGSKDYEVQEEFRKFYVDNKDIDTIFLKPYLDEFHIRLKYFDYAEKGEIDDLFENPHKFVRYMSKGGIIVLSVPYDNYVDIKNYLMPYCMNDEELYNVFIDSVRELVVGDKRYPLTLYMANKMKEKRYLTGKDADIFRLDTVTGSYVEINGQKKIVRDYFENILRGMAPKTIYSYIQKKIIRNNYTFNGGSISDCTMTVGAPIKYRIGTDMVDRGESKVMPGNMKSITEYLLKYMPDNNKEKFFKDKFTIFAYSMKGYGRFRISMTNQRGTVTLSIRRLPDKFIPFQAFGFGEYMKEKLLADKGGIYLITGEPNSGKTSLAASLINQTTLTMMKKIIALEAPIENLFRHNLSVVNQIEVGSDISSMEEALIMAVTSDPDILYITEIRNWEELSNVISMGESGIKVIATGHAGNIKESITRFIGMIPEGQRESKGKSFIAALKLIINQQLIPRAGGGQVPLQEILHMDDIRVNRAVSDIILSSDRSSSSNLYTFLVDEVRGNKYKDKDLYNLRYKYDLITDEIFKRFASETYEEMKTKGYAYTSKHNLEVGEAYVFED